MSDATNYPFPAFHFRVDIVNANGKDVAFKEVSGISVQIETEDLAEGGENGFVHKLPKSIKASNLILKRGIAESDSPLVQWCQATLEGGLSEPIEPKQIDVSLLNEKQEAVRRWTFDGAYPVKWEVDSFEATKNEIALETIELCYRSSKRTK